MLKHFTISLLLIFCAYSLYSCNSTVGRTLTAVNELRTFYKSDDIKITQHVERHTIVATVKNAKVFDDQTALSDNESDAMLEKYSLQGAQMIYSNLTPKEKIDSVIITLETSIGNATHGYRTAGWKIK